MYLLNFLYFSKVVNFYDWYQIFYLFLYSLQTPLSFNYYFFDQRSNYYFYVLYKLHFLLIIIISLTRDQIMSVKKIRSQIELGLPLLKSGLAQLGFHSNDRKN